MPSVPKPPAVASFLDRLSPAARAAVESRVNVEQALGFVGQAGRPGQATPQLADAPPGRELSRRDRRAHKKLDDVAERERRRRARDTRAEKRFARRMAEWGAEAPPGGWRGVGRDVWVMGWDCFADGTGAVLRYWMGRERNKTAVGAAKLAALAGGERTWSDPTARAIMTCALVQLRLAEPTKRKGRWSGGIVRGIPVGVFAAMLAPPGASARIPHRNTLYGRHRGARSAHGRGQAGYLCELAAAGFMYSQQLPADEVEPFERCGPSGHACNRYWLVSQTPSSVQDQSEREALIALHRSGQLAHCETLSRPGPRARVTAQNAADSRAQHLRAAVFAGRAHPPPE